MKKISMLLSVLGIVLLASPASVLAQDEEAAPALSDIWIIVPKAGMEGEFTAAVKKHMAFRAEAGDSRVWRAYTVELGHHIGPVQFRACCFEWADLDGYEAESAENGYNENWNENVHQYVDHYHHYLERFDYENSHWPEGEGEGPFYGVTTWSIKQGSGPASGEARAAMSQLAINEGWEGNWLWITRIGGKPELSIVSPFANFEEMAPPEQSFFEFASEKMGEEEAAKMFSDFGSGFTGSDYTVWRYSEELSMAEEE